MEVSVQRVYDYEPSSKGTAILVDRLWPRGITKARLHNVAWVKELAPSNELRRWFHEDKAARYTSFASKYEAELTDNQQVLQERLRAYKKPIVLLTAVKEIEQSHIPTLQDFLKKFCHQGKCFLS